MERSELYVGQRIELNPAAPDSYRNETYRVVKINPKNVKIEGEKTGRLVNSHPQFLLLADDQTPAAPKPFTMTHEFTPRMTLGTAVTVRGGIRNYAPDTVWVVIKNGTDRTNVAKLGGDNDIYWRVDPKKLERYEITV